MGDCLTIPRKPVPDHQKFDHPDRVNKSGSEISMPVVFEVTNTTKEPIMIDLLSKECPAGLLYCIRNEFPEIIDFDEILSGNAKYDYCIGLVSVDSASLSQKKAHLNLFAHSMPEPYYVVCPPEPIYKWELGKPAVASTDFWLTGDKTQSFKYEIEPNTFVKIKLYPAIRNLKLLNQLHLNQ